MMDIPRLGLDERTIVCHSLKFSGRESWMTLLNALSRIDDAATPRADHVLYQRAGTNSPGRAKPRIAMAGGTHEILT